MCTTATAHVANRREQTADQTLAAISTTNRADRHDVHIASRPNAATQSAHACDQNSVIHIDQSKTYFSVLHRSVSKSNLPAVGGPRQGTVDLYFINRRAADVPWPRRHDPSRPELKHRSRGIANTFLVHDSRQLALKRGMRAARCLHTNNVVHDIVAVADKVHTTL
jgi:hypothetical protein